MPEIRTLNGMSNVPSCLKIVTLETSDVIPIMNFCIVLKLVNILGMIRSSIFLFLFGFETIRLFFGEEIWEWSVDLVFYFSFIFWL
jgi:hypothetical protein